MEMVDILHNKELWSTEGRFIDLLEKVKNDRIGLLRTALQTYKPSQYKYSRFENPDDVWKTALKSERVQTILRQISTEDKLSMDDVTNQATKILKEMAYTDHMTIVRLLGFALLMVVKSIYPEGIFVNPETIEKLKDLVKHYPVVFIPSHKSYLDFLIITPICFCTGLPIPAIAAGMDLMNMKFLGEALRSSGGFFMRRSFGADRLYWALFTEYVHAALINSSRTMEFFIEGTRSRTGKSLNPKLGLLSVVAEPYLKGQLFDTMLVPVSVSYQRIVEESLYAYELLGVPKPKESTSALLSAASILKENYGSIHVQFSSPISLRKSFSKVDRVHHAKGPCYVQHLSEVEQAELKTLAYKIVKCQQRNMVIGIWPVVALVFSLNQYSISFSRLITELKWLKMICSKCSVKVQWMDDNGLEESVLRALNMFNHIVTLHTQTDNFGNVVHGQVEINESTYAASKSKLGSKAFAINYLVLANYKNQVLDGFVGAGLLTLALEKNLSSPTDHAILSREKVFNDFKFLCQSLKNDFIFIPGGEEKLFTASVQILESCFAIERRVEGFQLSKDSERILVFFRDIFYPFIHMQVLVVEYFLVFSSFVEFSQAKGKVQQWIYEHIELKTCMVELISLDLISNTLFALGQNGCLRLSKVQGKKWIFPNLKHLEGYIEVIEKFSPNEHHHVRKPLSKM